MKKIAVFHDHFMYRGGGERLISLLAKSIGADLISGFFDAGSLDPREVGFEGKIIEITKPGFAFFDKRSYQKEKTKDRSLMQGASFILMKGLRHFALKLAILFQTRVLRQYDIVIFSGDGISAIKNCRKDAIRIYYCHTPPRYLFDQKDVYYAKVPLILRIPYRIACFLFEKMYRKDFAKMDLVLTNSKNVQNRIARYFGTEARIIYPPVDLGMFKPLGERKDYYFSWARLTEIKRVDRIAKAFMEMPDTKLVISYGKNDPEKVRILAMVKDSPNITTVESPDDEALVKLISESIATIYIPVDEDFGMTPVESLACGVPVIGVDDGGLKEIIENGKTGILIDKSAPIEEIKQSVRMLDIRRSLQMKEDCIERSKFFTLESFARQVRDTLDGFER